LSVIANYVTTFLKKRDYRETWAGIKNFLDALHSWDGSSENVIVLVVLGTHYMGLLLGPAPTGTGTIALDPTLGSFTLLEPISH
jgi:hypothetical protein